MIDSCCSRPLPLLVLLSLVLLYVDPSSSQSSGTSAGLSPNDRLALIHRDAMRTTCKFHVNRMADEALSMISEVITKGEKDTRANPASMPLNTINYPFPRMWFKCGNAGYYGLAELVNELCVGRGFMVKCNTSDTWTAVFPGNVTALCINLAVSTFDPKSGLPKPPCDCHWTDPDAPDIVQVERTQQQTQPPPSPAPEGKKPVPFNIPEVVDPGIKASQWDHAPKRKKNKNTTPKARDL
jgi:hypothetical protein